MLANARLVPWPQLKPIFTDENLVSEKKKVRIENLQAQAPLYGTLCF